MSATAYEILNGIKAIAKNDMLKRRVYIDLDIDPKLFEEGAVCGGHKACLVGSTYLAAGVVRQDMKTGELIDKSTDIFMPDTRIGFMKDSNPELLDAYEALNKAAERTWGDYVRAVEAGYESHDHYDEYEEKWCGLSGLQPWPTDDDLADGAADGVSFAEFCFEEIIEEDNTYEEIVRLCDDAIEILNSRVSA